MSNFNRMKRYLILLLLITGFAIGETDATKPRFFIQTEALGEKNGKSAEAYLAYFETLIFNGMKKTFPCVEMNSISAVKSLLDLERQKQLLGTGTDEALANIAGAMGCEYLICLRVTVNGGLATFTVFCMDSKKAETLARATETAAHGSAGVNAMENAAKSMIEDLKEYEICAYTGTVNFEVESEKDDQTSSSTPCDGGMITTQIKVKTKSTLKWNLNKNGLRKGDGDVSYDLKETTETTINNPCYICSNGQKVIAQIQEKKEVEAKANGLTHESISEGQKVADCRIKLVFLKDGTYNILVEATSQKGNMKTTVDRNVNAPCMTGKENEPEAPRNNEIEIPLKVVLGPYKGTTEDAALSQEETKDISQGKEKTTVKIHVSLTRQ